MQQLCCCCVSPLCKRSGSRRPRRTAAALRGGSGRCCGSCNASGRKSPDSRCCLKTEQTCDWKKSGSLQKRAAAGLVFEAVKRLVPTCGRCRGCRTDTGWWSVLRSGCCRPRRGSRTSGRLLQRHGSCTAYPRCTLCPESLKYTRSICTRLYFLKVEVLPRLQR